MRKVFVWLFLFLLLMGCVEQPPELPYIPPKGPRKPEPPKPLPVPEPTPANMEMVERAWKGLPATAYRARLQRRLQTELYLANQEYAVLEAMEKSLHQWPHANGDFFRQDLERFYRHCSFRSPELLEAWLAASPNSHAAHLVAARAALNDLYRVLGGKTPVAGGEKMILAIEPHLQKAEQHLGGEGIEECPAYHAMKIELANLSGASREEILELLKASDQVCVGYMGSYAQAAVHRLPAWTGASKDPKDDWLGTAELIPTPEGVDAELWKEARLSTLFHYALDMQSYRVSPAPTCPWDRYKLSFEATRKLLPKSVEVLSRYAALAAWRYDWDTVGETLPALGHYWDTLYWDDYGKHASALEKGGKKGVQADLTPPQGAFPEFPLPDRARQRFIQFEVEGLFDRAHFPELEAMAKNFPAGKEEVYWRALARDNRPSVDWVRLLETADVWCKAYPKSLTAKLCRARLWDAAAWGARGNGFYSEVKASQRMLFHQRAERGVKLYEELLKDHDDIDLTVDAGSLYLASSSNKERGFELLYQALEREPLNANVISALTHYSLPRWSGQPGDLGKLMQKINKLSKTQFGTSMVVSNALWARGSALFETEVTWKEAKAAYQAQLKDHGTPSIKSRYAVAAFYAGDRDTAKKVLTQLGDKWDPPRLSQDELRRIEELVKPK